MCGACRVLVGNETKFACVDGPEFDGHLVDFTLLMNRLSIYQPDEKLALKNINAKGRDAHVRTPENAGTGSESPENEFQ